jgi:hypothetical protein
MVGSRVADGLRLTNVELIVHKRINQRESSRASLVSQNAGGLCLKPSGALVGGVFLYQS